MLIRLLAFALTREQLGFHERDVPCSPDETPRQIVARIAPELDFAHLRAAVDCEYCDWDRPLGSARELAIIPPVSGG